MTRTMHSRRKGEKGEALAADHLERNGYTIIRKNYRTRYGEIDIIATNKICIVFVEVKTWDALDFEHIEYALTQMKLQRIVKTSRDFLFKHPVYNSLAIRYDVIVVMEKLAKIRHIEHAFTETDFA